MANNKLKLSIVILAYNEEDFIGNCLDSVASQTVMPDEVIVVNNNSTDQTVPIVKRYGFVKLINEPVQGMIRARNTGLARSSGDIVGRIDADTILPPNWVENVHKAYQKRDHENTLLTGGTAFTNAPFKTFGYICHYLIFFSFSSRILGFKNLFGSNMVLTRKAINCLLRTSCRNEHYHEDVDLSLHFKFNGFQVNVVNNLRVEITLRGILSQAFASDNRVEIWKNTLRAHGVSRLRVFFMLGPASIVIKTVARLQLLTRRLQTMLAN